MVATVKMDARKVAVAARLARFAAKAGSSVTSCPYRGDDDEDRALRRVWLSTYMRMRPPKSGSVDYSGSDVAAAASSEGTSDPEALQREYDDAKAAMLAGWPAVAAAMVAALAEDAGAMVAAGDLAGLAGLEVPPAIVAEIAAWLAEGMTSLAGLAAAQVVAEAKRQGVTIEAPEDPGGQRIRQVAEVTATLIAGAYTAAATRRAMGLSGDAATITAGVAEALGAMSTAERGMVADNIGGGLNAAQNAGRQSVIEEHPPARFVAVEHTPDGNQCEPCREIAGKVFDDWEEALTAYPIHGYVACLGRDRCRGHLAPIWSD